MCVCVRGHTLCASLAPSYMSFLEQDGICTIGLVFNSCLSAVKDELDEASMADQTFGKLNS